MVHLECVKERNRDPQMHAASRVPGARGAALRRAIAHERKVVPRKYSKLKISR